MMPGTRLPSTNGKPRQLAVEVSWSSHYPIDRIEIVQNGRVVRSHALIGINQQRHGIQTHALKIESDGWIAARAYGNARDSFAQAIYAHTSPIYIGDGIPADAINGSAEFFVRSIDDSINWINKTGRFTQDQQREEILHLFNQGRKVYSNLAGMN